MQKLKAKVLVIRPKFDNVVHERMSVSTGESTGQSAQKGIGRGAWLGA